VFVDLFSKVLCSTESSGIWVA